MISLLSAIYCMSQKTERPVLSGQRIKTRKRGKIAQLSNLANKQIKILFLLRTWLHVYRVYYYRTLAIKSSYFSS